MLSKTTILFIFLLQIVTRPNIENIEGWLIEAGIFLIAVTLGSGLRIAMKAKSREGIVRKEALLIFFFGFSLGFAANYAMIFYGWNVPRPLVVWAVSLLAEFILIWIEKRYPKLFDSIFEKVTNTNIDKNNREDIIDEYNDEEYDEDDNP